MNIFVLLAHTTWYKYSRVALSLNCRHKDTVVFQAALQTGLAVPVAPGCTGRSKAVSRLHSHWSGQMAGAGSVLGSSWHSSWSCC